MSEDKILKVQSSRFGELEVPEESVLELIGGIIGFDSSSKFVLLDYKPPFSWLQSVEDPKLAFVVVNAAEFGDGYQFNLPLGDRDLDLSEDDDVAVLNLVSVRADPSATTVNLKAPVVVNLKNMKGRQIILDNQRYPTRAPLWETKKEAEAKKKAEEEGGEK